jgi:type I restriction enzyme S subunit
MKRIEIPLPPLPVQQRIADVLGALDDKIEVNRRINRVLEQMAQALFRHWFVDFGPFQGGEFVESELGPIPAGWEVTTIGSVCKVISGSTPKTKVAEYWEGGGIYWATPTDMTALSSPVILETSRSITTAGLNSCSAQILPIGAVLVTSRATLGVAAISYAPMATNQGFKSMICGRRVTNHFMLLYIQLNQDLITGNANGSTFLEISGKNFKALPLVVPPPDVMQDFEAIVKPLYDQIVVNERENDKLAATRDYLLPRLLSGEVTVPEGEALLAT